MGVPVSADTDLRAGPVQAPADEGGKYSVNARGGLGVQVGEGNTQIIYSYSRLTWTDGVAPPPLVSISGVVESPYRGLRAFEEQDAAFFFGRETVTTQLLERMSRSAQGGGLLMVSGVSGAGKSSLLQAGMLPQIRGSGMAAAPGAASWPCLLFTPTRDPLDELALRVALLAGADAAVVRRGLDTDPEGFALTARQAALAPPPGPESDPELPLTERHQPARRRLLLVVDQFEQLFTQCPDERQRQAFITALCAAARAGHGPDQAPAALVVLGVRADFEARCAEYPLLAGAVQDRYLVTAMTGRQLRMAITEPAKKAGSQVDDDLVKVLLAEVGTREPGGAGAGVLPLLSHALDQAWRSRSGEALSVADYERTGGIEGAVADSAQRAYDRLTPSQQAAARQVFTRLTAVSTAGVDTADRATTAELTEGKSKAQVRDAETVLEAFAAERLLTLAADSVEISHEVLLSAWPLLRDTWLADTRADRIVRTRLHVTAAEWARHFRDPSYLYSGTLLQTATQTAARIGADPARHPPLSQAERSFLHASGRARRRIARRRHAVIAGLLALTLTAVTAAGIAGRNAASATRQHALALSRQLAAESLTISSAHPVTARRLAVAAWSVSHTAQAGSVMTTLLTQQQQNGMVPADPYGVPGVAFSPSGNLLATADGDGTVRLWNPLTGQADGAPLRTGSGHQDSVRGLTFSPNGKLLATANRDGTVWLWNPVTGQPIGAPIHATSGYWGGVSGVAFSPNGKLLASADGDGTVKLWNPATGQAVGAPLHATTDGATVTGVAFSPNGKLLASAEDNGTVRIWNPLTDQALGVPPPPTNSNPPHDASAVAFSPDGKLLASYGDRPIRLRNPVTGQPAGAPLQTGGRNSVSGVAFSPNGNLLATTDGSGTVRLWNPVTGQPAGTPLHATSTQYGVSGLAFSPNGKLLATADGDGTVRLWNPVTGQPAGAPLHATRTPVDMSEVAFSPHGMLVASANGTVRLWNPVTGQAAAAPLRTRSNSQNSVSAVALSPNGKLLASADGDGTVRVWNTVTGQALGPIFGPTLNGGVYPTGLAFSPNGKLLASADGDGTVRVWNPVTGQAAGGPLHVTRAPRFGASGAVAFSPDGTLLATAYGNGTLRLWNPVTGQAIRTLLHATPAPAGVPAVAFSPDGKLLASADGDGRVRLWNPVTGQAARTLLQTRAKYRTYGAVAFSPDGKLLASADDNGTVRFWNPVTGQAAGAPFDAADARSDVSGVAFSPNGRLLATADSDGTVRLWKVSLFANPYTALCTDVGPPTRQDWAQYAPGVPHPRVCA